MAARGKGDADGMIADDNFVEDLAVAGPDEGNGACGLVDSGEPGVVGTEDEIDGGAVWLVGEGGLEWKRD